MAYALDVLPQGFVAPGALAAQLRLTLPRRMAPVV
jgi:hypothetical protein